MLPPDGYEFVSNYGVKKKDDNKDDDSKNSSNNSKNSSNNRDNKFTPTPILCGSGKKYYLCYKRKTDKRETPITDIQITFKSSLPLGYFPLNYTVDGEQLPYFQKQQNKTDNNKNNNNDDNKNNDKNSDAKKKNNDIKQNGHSDVKLNGNGSNNDNNGENESENTQVSFDSVPLIIFSRTGDSPIVHISLKNSWIKISDSNTVLDITLDKQRANLNHGARDTSLVAMFLTIGNDLSGYRFDAKDLLKHINLKYLTPLLVSLHLRNTDLAITSINSLKYLLLSNFIRFKDHSLVKLALKKICKTVSQSIINFDKEYHELLYELQIIIFQKFIHYLDCESLWLMLVSTLIPVNYTNANIFLKKYRETSFKYIQVLCLGDEVGIDGNAFIQSFAKISFETLQPIKITNTNSMKKYLNQFINDTISKKIAENCIIKLFKTNQLSSKSVKLIYNIITSLFESDIDKPWISLSVLILFITRCGLSPYHIKVSKQRMQYCTHCTLILEKIIDLLTEPKYVQFMPKNFKFLLRRTITRTMAYNLSNKYYKYEDILNSNLRFFEKICISWYSFFQNEIGIILNQTILPQLLERCTPWKRRQKYITCLSRILRHSDMLINLTYSLDVIQGKRAIHSIIDSILAIIVETSSILKHHKTKLFELVNNDKKSFINVYNLHHLSIQCLNNISNSYGEWFQRHIITNSAVLLANGSINVAHGETELLWQKWTYFHKIQEKAKDLASNIKDDKGVKKAIKLLLSKGFLQNDGAMIADWIHLNKYSIPKTNIGEYLGGTAPKNSKPIEEDVRLYYMRKCDVDFELPLEIVMDRFLTKCGFRMAKEGQKIERTLESFAQVYFENNTDSFDNADGAFVVFNAILMLNTSLHNPQIKAKDKLQKNIFISMCQGVKASKLTYQTLSSIYDYIKNNPYEIKFDNDDQNNNNNNNSSSRRFHEWKRKYLIANRKPILASTLQIRNTMRNLQTQQYLSMNNLAHNYASTNSLFPKSNSVHSNSKAPRLFKLSANGSDFTSPVVTPNGSLYNSAQLSQSFDFPSILPHQKSTIDISEMLNHDSDDDQDDDIKEYLTHNPSLHMSIHSTQISQQPDDTGFDSDEDIDMDLQKQMLINFENHSKAEDEQDIKEYEKFCDEIFVKSFNWIKTVAIKQSDITPITEERLMEVACLLLDNWWSRILDASKTVFELTDDPYTTPLLLAIFPPILQIGLSLGCVGHEPAKIAFDELFKSYKAWWMEATKRIGTSNMNKRHDNIQIHTGKDLQNCFNKIWDVPQTEFEILRKYFQISQKIIYDKTQQERLRIIQFQFPDINIILKSREFIGEQTVKKIGAHSQNTTYKLFFFNDMLIYATGKPGKYKAHRVLFVIFCALENMDDNKFKIHSSQKTVIIELPTIEYKKICFKKINELISKQRKQVKQLIINLKNSKYPGHPTLANKYANSCKFLHQNMTTVIDGVVPLPNHCKLCLFQYKLSRSKKLCPVCEDYVCKKCIQRKTRYNNKKRNVCDGCYNIVQKRLKLI